LAVINILKMSDYLKGVMAREISPRWDMEVIKAQAIAARTYALYQMNKNKDLSFDVSSDVYSQVYAGVYSEDTASNRAVDDTKGLVLTIHGDIFPAYFHATCAGQTENADNLWEINLPSLKSVACAFCQESPHYTWQLNISLKEIQKRLLNIKGASKSSIVSIDILGRTLSHRVHWMAVTYKDGTVLKFSGNTFRLKVDPDRIRSTNFDVMIKNNHGFFKGKGWGHGVGLCQWGAKQLAEKGMKAKDILQHYYQGARIVKA